VSKPGITPECEKIGPTGSTVLHEDTTPNAVSTVSTPGITPECEKTGETTSCIANATKVKEKPEEKQESTESTAKTTPVSKEIWNSTGSMPNITPLCRKLEKSTESTALKTIGSILIPESTERTANITPGGSATKELAIEIVMETISDLTSNTIYVKDILDELIGRSTNSSCDTTPEPMKEDLQEEPVVYEIPAKFTTRKRLKKYKQKGIKESFKKLQSQEEISTQMIPPAQS
jgi:hypothetical protein